VGLQNPEAAAQQARRGGQLGGKRKRREGIEDRKEETTEEMVEQRALYTWAKRREGALPDRVGLNPKRQRTGSFSTSTLHFWMRNVLKLILVHPSNLLTRSL
jgi:hypothetical protein